VLQIADGAVELAGRNVPVAAVPVHPRVLRVPLHAFGEDVDGGAVLAEVRQAATQPDDGVRILRVALVDSPGLAEVFLQAGAGLRRKGGREQRPPQQREGFHPCRWLRRALAAAPLTGTRGQHQDTGDGAGESDSIHESPPRGRLEKLLPLITQGPSRFWQIAQYAAQRPGVASEGDPSGRLLALAGGRAH
jgi:hypothetical protein